MNSGVIQWWEMHGEWRDGGMRHKDRTQGSPAPAGEIKEIFFSQLTRSRFVFQGSHLSFGKLFLCSFESRAVPFPHCCWVHVLISHSLSTPRGSRSYPKGQGCAISFPSERGSCSSSGVIPALHPSNKAGDSRRSLSSALPLE